MEEEVIVLMEIVDERVTLRGVGRAWVAFVRTMARWTHHHWNFIAWPVDAILGIVVAIATFQGTWQFIWSAVLDERSWPPEITLFVIKPLVGVLLGAAWLHLVLARELPIVHCGVFGLAGVLTYDWRHRYRPGTLGGYAKTAAFVVATLIAWPHISLPGLTRKIARLTIAALLG